MKVFFYINSYKSPKESNYSHCAICLAEGFRELNIQFSGNVNYWLCPKNNEYLISKNFDIEEADIVIYSAYMLPEKLIQNKFKVYIDFNDGFETPEKMRLNEKFNLVLKCHYRAHFPYPANVVPWAFGLTNRVIEYTHKYIENNPASEILNTYRVPQNLREKTLTEFSKTEVVKKYPFVDYVSDDISLDDINLQPVEKLYWQQTGRRHNDSYYKRLSESLLILTFGGIIHPLPNTLRFFDKIPRQYYKFMNFIFEKLQRDNRPFNFIYQYDSWRFWEAMLSMNCPICLNFENWGLLMPVNPIDNIHYLGLKNFNYKELSHRILRLNEKELKIIGEKGREWALNNYSPKIVSQRLINIISKKK